MTTQTKDKTEEKAVAERRPTVAERFVGKVKREFNGAVGHGVEFTDSEKQLASNLFVKIDSALKQHEADRVQRNQDKKTPFKWENVNMQKLATDAVHLVRLGLDASIKNHVHVIPYFNGKTKVYDLDLQVGYAGKDYYRRRMAVEEVENIRYELVHETDHFKVIKSDSKTEKDHYEFEIPEPFNRGAIKGGFGYIEYKNDSKNQLVVVTEEEFRKVKNKAQTNKIWNEWPEKMRMKTLVHRVTDELTMDPAKINPSYKYVEDNDNPFDDPKNEVKIEQPTERPTLDIDASNGEPDPEPVENETDSTNGSGGAESSTDIDREALMAEITSAAKAIARESGDKWFNHIKRAQADINPDAETMMDLNDEELQDLHVEMINQHDEAV